MPQVWGEAIVIPISKRSKDKLKAESHQPISLRGKADGMSHQYKTSAAP